MTWLEEDADEGTTYSGRSPDACWFEVSGRPTRRIYQNRQGEQLCQWPRAAAS